MIQNLALLITAAAAQASIETGMVVATDKELSTSVHLVETADTIRFEFTGPAFVAPSVAIDVHRNGVIDHEADFKIGFSADDGSPCFQRLLHEGRSSVCLPLGSKGQLNKTKDGDSARTTVTLPKSAISGDGFGFGFAISLWNVNEDHGGPLAAGDYRFGGTLSLVGSGANFLGEKRDTLPSLLKPAVRGYQGCLMRSTKALEPLNGTKLAKLEAVPASCAEQRQMALREGVAALVTSGMSELDAAKAMQGVLDRMETGFRRLVEVVRKGSKRP